MATSFFGSHNRGGEQKQSLAGPVSRVDKNMHQALQWKPTEVPGALMGIVIARLKGQALMLWIPIAAVDVVLCRNQGFEWSSSLKLESAGINGVPRSSSSL
ncbi:hypothetical protein U1Q18_006937 [Sarracenia purpurea var. burkii]